MIKIEKKLVASGQFYFKDQEGGTWGAEVTGINARGELTFCIPGIDAERMAIQLNKKAD
jgi:hypothetical protein